MVSVDYTKSTVMANEFSVRKLLEFKETSVWLGSLRQGSKD